MNEWGGGINECRAIQKRLDGQCKQRRRPKEHIRELTQLGRRHPDDS